MFTGLIEHVCQVKSAAQRAGAMEIAVDLGPLAEGTKIGDSIAIDGVCLTVTRLAGTVASFDVSGETLEKSAIRGIKPADKVNAERAMPAMGRFGGHFVQGHVDGTATVKSITDQGRFSTIRFSASADLLSGMVNKGSVAINGVSLTVADSDSQSFSVAVIPETLAKPTLGSAKTGDLVNIEIDIITKVIKKQLENMLGGKEALTMDKLKQMGF